MYAVNSYHSVVNSSVEADWGRVLRLLRRIPLKEVDDVTFKRAEKPTYHEEFLKHLRRAAKLSPHMKFMNNEETWVKGSSAREFLEGSIGHGVFLLRRWLEEKQQFQYFSGLDMRARSAFHHAVALVVQ
eukprot:gene25179-11004_t